MSGKSSSTAGLTVSIHHEKGNNTSLGAGPLLLADQGTCCIDELDKMSNSNQVRNHCLLVIAHYVLSHFTNRRC